MASDGRLQLAYLCDDLLVQVLDRLSPNQLLSVESVSHTFQRCCHLSLHRVKVMRFHANDQPFGVFSCRHIDTTSNSGNTVRILSNDRHFDRHNTQQLLPLLGKCPSIECLDFGKVVVSGPDLVRIVGQCPKLECFYIHFHTADLTTHFDADDWNRFTETVGGRLRHAAIELVNYDSDSSAVDRVKTLFRSAPGLDMAIVSVRNLNKDILMAISELNAAATVKVDACQLAQDVVTDKEVADVISRFDQMSIPSDALQAIGNRFSKLTKLKINYYQDKINSVIDFPQLKSLSLFDFDADAIKSISLFRFHQLEELEIHSLEEANDEDLVNVFKQLPRIKRLAMSDFEDALAPVEALKVLDKLEQFDLLAVMEFDEERDIIFKMLGVLKHLSELKRVAIQLQFNITKLRRESVGQLIDAISEFSLDKPEVVSKFELLVDPDCLEWGEMLDGKRFADKTRVTCRLK